MRLITHNGVFHKDDVFCTAAIHRFMARTAGLPVPEYKEAGGSVPMLIGIQSYPIQVLRIRDFSTISVEVTDTIVDVGGVYDTPTGRYDHHQEGSPVRENGIRYSAFGLVCEKMWGKEPWFPYFLPIVLAIDAHDNGQFELAKTMDLRDVGGWVVSFNPSYGETPDFDAAFMDAVAVALPILDREIASAKAKWRANVMLEKALVKASDGIMTLDAAAPWADFVKDNAEGIKRVVFPDSFHKGQWNCQQVKGADPLPMSIRELPGFIFRHGTGFFACFSSKESATLAAKEL